MAGSWFFFILLLSCIPRSNAQKAEQIGLIYLGHASTAFQQRIIGEINEIRQRYDGVSRGISFIYRVSAAFVGNSERISVVCVCTAISASAISCMNEHVHGIRVQYIIRRELVSEENTEPAEHNIHGFGDLHLFTLRERVAFYGGGGNRDEP